MKHINLLLRKCAAPVIENYLFIQNDQLIHRQPEEPKRKILRTKISATQKYNKIRRESNFRKRYNFDNFMKIVNPHLGPFLSEFVSLKIKGKTRCTPYQKWIAVNIMVACGISGYNLMRQLLPLPSPTTIHLLLKSYKTDPGINEKNIEMLKLKVNPQSYNDKCTYILIDEVSLRKGLAYHQTKDTIFG